MKVGDLVRCPPYINGDHRVPKCIGVVLEMEGYKITVGTPRGTEIWDQFDLLSLAELAEFKRKMGFESRR